ncbi:MAG: branched-chain amino acid transporter permease [Pseudonocardiales bacterium]|nr:branched-chain amino acid transporter permease [Jatrophihabitantaceae bacterium]MCW2604580.1 branched-chain amino acid transporter permease [Pseudonocardiales bacterium]
MNDFIRYTIAGLTLGSMYALIALGYTLVYGVLQLINFAHSEVFMTGAFGSYIVVDTLVGGHGRQNGFMVVVVLGVGLITGALSGAGAAWLLERVAYRPLRRRGAPKLAFLISAIGASFFMSQLAGKLFNRQKNNSFPNFFDNRVLFSIGEADVRLLQVIIIVAAVVLMFFLDRLVQKTKLGRSIRAVAEDAPTAALMGINIDKTISRTFVIGGALGGAAGFLFALFSSLSYQMGFFPGTKAFAAAVLGGIGNPRGAMLGGLTLGLVENWSVMFLPSQWTNVIAFAVLVLVLMFRPSGILGERLGRAA